MRSLALKLTLAFLIVGLIGAVLVALFVRQQTHREFGQFVLDRSQADLVDQLTEYYWQTGSWQGINAIFIRGHGWRPGMWRQNLAPVTLIDADRFVVYGGLRYRAGEQLSQQDSKQGAPIKVDGETVGWVLFDSFDPVSPESPETEFLKDVNRAIIYGAAGATAVALLLGILLARTISRPVQELTTATQIVARGKLGHQVPVRTQDELGELAASFNRMSADLARSNRLRRQMTADIAHDLRTPLSVIMGYTEALADDKLQGASEMYAVMHNEAQHLSHLIDDLRTLSLADAGELPLTRRPVAPLALLERTASAHAAQARKRQVALKVEAAPDLPTVEVDPERMAQMLGNLVSNALRYTPEGGQITLAAQADADAVTLRIQDNGAGIAPQELPHIFDRFYRGDRSRQQGEGESGLGLAIAKSLVEAHGGSISAASTLGQGTTFTISLPS
jgi:two-component system sensor histidine kinase BaeS